MLQKRQIKNIKKIKVQNLDKNLRDSLTMYWLLLKSYLNIRELILSISLNVRVINVSKPYFRYSNG